MGLTARKDILLWLKEICPLAFLKTMPFLAMWVYVEDFLTRAPFLRAKNRKDGLFTGSEAFDVFIGPTLNHLNNSCLVAIFTIDDAATVPSRKKAEQDRRDLAAATKKQTPRNPRERLKASDCPSPAEEEAKKVVEKKKKAAVPRRMYAPRSFIEDDGIRQPPSEITQRFHLFDLTRQRALRPALAAYYAARVSDMFLPPGRRVIIDFDSSREPRHSIAATSESKKQVLPGAPLEFFGRSGTKPRNRLLPNYRHPFGEGELACAFWLHCYATKHDCVYTTYDSDALPIGVHLCFELGLHKIEGRKLIWNDGRGVLVNICEVARTLERMGITSWHFAAACGLGGCDYVHGITLWPSVPGGQYGRVRKAMSNYNMFGPRDCLFWPLPLNSRKEECLWTHMLMEQRVVPFLDGVHDLADIVVDYVLGCASDEQGDPGAAVTPFEMCIENLCSKNTKIGGVVSRQDWRREMQSLAWFTQYCCVPWSLLGGVPCPNA